MALTILNLLLSPYIMFFAQKNDVVVLRDLIILQTCIQIVYLADLVIMILVFGLK